MLFICFFLCLFQAKYECALRHSNIKIVTPEWILDSVKEKNRKDETLYHPRLTLYEAPEEDGSEYENERSSGSEGSYSDRRSPHSRRSSPTSSRDASPVGRRSRSTSPKHERKSELMFDDSDDSSPEKEDRNLNWTPAEVPQPGPAKRRLQPGKETGLINLCANVPPVPGGFGPPDARLVGTGGGVPLGVERSEVMGGWNSTPRTLRNITNNADTQQASRPSNVRNSFERYDRMYSVTVKMYPLVEILISTLFGLHDISKIDIVKWLSTIGKSRRLTYPI